MKTSKPDRQYRVTATNPDGAILMDAIRNGALAAAQLIDRMRGRVDLADCVFRAEACA